MSYVSHCGRYRVDRVETMGRTVYWRPLVSFARPYADCWEFLTRTRYRTKTAAQAACEKHARLPAVCQIELPFAAGRGGRLIPRKG